MSLAFKKTKKKELRRIKWPVHACILLDIFNRRAAKCHNCDVLISSCFMLSNSTQPRHRHLSHLSIQSILHNVAPLIRHGRMQLWTGSYHYLGHDVTRIGLSFFFFFPFFSVSFFSCRKRSSIPSKRLHVLCGFPSFCVMSACRSLCFRSQPRPRQCFHVPIAWVPASVLINFSFFKILRNFFFVSQMP